MKAPRKYDISEFKEKVTWFFNDKNFEEIYNKGIEKKVDLLMEIDSDICERECLLNYIFNDRNSLKNLLTLMELSDEKFKRIISMIRATCLSEEVTTSSEWGISTIRNQIITNTELREYVLSLLLPSDDKSSNTKSIRSKIPKFYLDIIGINEYILSILGNREKLRALVVKKAQGDYSVQVGKEIENKIEDKLKDLKNIYGIDYVRNEKPDFIDRRVDFIIPSVEDPYVIIESSYQVTTGSSQTTKKNTMRNIQDAVRQKNRILRRNHDDDNRTVFVNFIEGAGWLARYSDMEQIINDSDYIINLKTLDMLERIIVRHVPIEYFTKRDKPQFEG